MTTYDLNRSDRLMDRTVIPGYTRIGYATRRRWWDDPTRGGLAGKHVLITGATSGIGRAAAAQCATYGAHVHVLGHNPRRGADALAWLTRVVPGGDFTLESCDLQSLGDVRRFAADFAARVPVLHALVHNAGVMSPEREETEDGHERTLAVHVLAPHLLTHLLAPRLAEAELARVVFMSSGGMYAQRLPADDLEFTKDRYSGSAAYSRTKRMQVVLAHRWAGELAGDQTAVHSMHPGWVDTPACRPTSPSSAASPSRSCVRPSRAPTPSPGWWRRLRSTRGPAASGTTGRCDRRTTSVAPARRHTSVSSCGTTARRRPRPPDPRSCRQWGRPLAGRAWKGFLAVQAASTGEFDMALGAPAHSVTLDLGVPAVSLVERLRSNRVETATLFDQRTR